MRVISPDRPSRSRAAQQSRKRDRQPEFSKRNQVAVDQGLLAAGTTTATKRDLRCGVPETDACYVRDSCADPVAIGRTSSGASVWRSTTLRTGLTRLNVTRIVAVACIGAVGLLPAVSAHAVTTSDQIAATTRRSTPPAQRWFAAQANAARIDASIADVEHQIADRASGAWIAPAELATARAVVIYKNADVGSDVGVRRQRSRLGPARPSSSTTPTRAATPRSPSSPPRSTT